MHIQCIIEIKEENFDEIVQAPQLDKDDQKQRRSSGIQIISLMHFFLFSVVMELLRGSTTHG